MKRAVKKEAPKLSEQVKRSHEARSKPQEDTTYDGNFMVVLLQVVQS